MNDALPNFELLLREALAPVEPPADLVERVESALEAITEMAADELEAWELSAMRDPRNWVRPAAAVIAGGAAGSALVLLRARRRARAAQNRSGAARAYGELSAGLERSAQRALQQLAQQAHELSEQTRRLLERD
ncbi:MAG TPA: hypothetical protein VGX51_05180 [Solirubrobacteraceae bacterium]|jgi:hypothetical protein|nr:hypothetical protein [Solirubrobacteraceae bacterium]